MPDVMPDIIPASEMPKHFPGTTVQFWNMKRHKGTGPNYLKLDGRKVYYRRTDIEAWLNSNVYSRPDRPMSAARDRKTAVRARITELDSGGAA